MRIIVYSIVTFAVLTLAGCVGSESCTALGCGDALSLSLVSNAGAWADGSYELSINADGTLLECQFDLSSTGAAPAACAIGVRRMDAATLRVEGLPAAETLEVSLAEMGAAPVTQATTPSYAISRPNGPDCEPECRQASEELTF